MARITSPLFTGMHKSIGNLVFYTRDGKQFVRKKSEQIKNPRTPAQVLQRKKFSFLVGAAKETLQALLLGNPQIPLNKIRGKFIQWNMQALEDDGKGGFRFNKPKAVFAQGTLPIPNIKAEITENGFGAVFRFNSQEDYRKACWTFGNIYVIAWGEEDAQFCVFPLILRGQMKPISVRFPTITPWKHVHFYTFGISPDGMEASDSMYIE